MKIFQMFVTIMGITMSLGYFPQVHKIWKNKSAADISISSFIIFSIGTLTWLIYGILVHDITIILGFIIGVIGSWSVLGMSILYRKNKHEIS
jgi:MtN3 and saliva related transmembrane protein